MIGPSDEGATTGPRHGRTASNTTNDNIESLSHTKWDCKYYVVFIPKCPRKTVKAGAIIPH
jgi:hypothetical protein